MEESKKWWESKTVWGGIVALGAAAAGAFGVTVDSSMQAEIVDYMMVAIGGIGGLIAIYGRIKAQQKIGK